MYFNGKANKHTYKRSKNKRLHPSEHLSHTSDLKLLHTLLDITKGVVCETGTLKLSLLSVEAFGLVLLNNVKLDYIVY